MNTDTPDTTDSLRTVRCYGSDVDLGHASEALAAASDRAAATAPHTGVVRASLAAGLWVEDDDGESVWVEAE